MKYAIVLSLQCPSPSYLYSHGTRLLNMVKRGALFAPKGVVIKTLGLRVLKWRDKNGSFFSINNYRKQVVKTADN